MLRFKKFFNKRFLFSIMVKLTEKETDQVIRNSRRRGLFAYAFLILSAVNSVLYERRLNNSFLPDQSRYVGVVQEFALTGTFFKTYEGKLATDSGVLEFSLDSEARNGENLDDLLLKLNYAHENKVPVVLNAYRQAAAWPWRSGTGLHVQEVWEK